MRLPILILVLLITAPAAHAFSFEVLVNGYRSAITGYASFVLGEEYSSNFNSKNIKSVHSQFTYLIETYAQISRNLSDLAANDPEHQAEYEQLQLKIASLMSRMTNELNSFENDSIDWEEFKKRARSILEECDEVNKSLLKTLL